MRAKLFTNRLKIRAKAQEYVRLVTGAPRNPTTLLQESSTGEAQDILETIRDQNQPDDLDINIEGSNLINQMDHDLGDFDQIPYWFSNVARSRGEAIVPGVRVIINGDTSRHEYRTLEVSFEQESVRIRGIKGRQFTVPWDLVVPIEAHEKDRPYWFTALARERGEDLQIGDYVCVMGLAVKYELMDIFWDHGDVEVREVGSVEYHGLPWRHIRPWKE